MIGMYIAAVQAAVVLCGTQMGGDRQRVQHQLAVAEIDALQRPGRTGRVKVVARVFSSKSGKSYSLDAFASKTSYSPTKDLPASPCRCRYRRSTRSASPSPVGP